jgi:hypothetical protein
VKMENVGLSVDFHWTLWKSNRPLIYLMSAGFGCSSDSSMVSLCNGEYRPGQLYILSSRVAPDTTDADVHALCTKPTVLKTEVRRWRYYRNPNRNAWIYFLPHLLRVLLIEKRILPGIMVVDKFLFCLFWRMEHPYSDVNIIYSVIQTGERTTDQGTKFSPKH